ncbi:MAG: hypothetical protein QJR13_08595, partial [Bacillota bacterium]|nr:hypothetical protein [Bacillota bacterium]
AQIVRQANEEASLTLARAREEAAQKVRALLTEAERKAAQHREAALRRSKEEEERLSALARQRLEQAASFIIEKVMGTYGHR